MVQGFRVEGLGAGLGCSLSVLGLEGFEPLGPFTLNRTQPLHPKLYGRKYDYRDRYRYI